MIGYIIMVYINNYVDLKWCVFELHEIYHIVHVISCVLVVGRFDLNPFISNNKFMFDLNPIHDRNLSTTNKM